MDLIQPLLPNQLDLTLQSWTLDPETQQVICYLSSRPATAHCPVCHGSTHRIHSRYERTLKDLPLVQFGLTLVLTVCKFFCLSALCPRRIFTQRLPSVMMPWARRTTRYSEHLKAIALALGGAAAARLSHVLGYSHSRNAMLRLICSLQLPSTEMPKIVGVDDFALRKGHHYGTILVDLERHQPIALLPDRTAETLATWLQAHPSIEILSRDRSKSYRRGMSQGAPHAIQVADRFHLLHNLEETLETVFKGHTQAIKQAEQAQLTGDASASTQSLEPTPLLPSPQTLKRTQRLERYEQVHALRQQGYRIHDIAHHLGMGSRTVYTYLSHETFPEWQPSIRKRGSGLDPYKGYLLERWHGGTTQTKQLFADIQQLGYRGSYATVARYTRHLRQSPVRPTPKSLNDLPGRGPAPNCQTVPRVPLSARRAAWLILQRDETLTSDEERIREHLCQQPDLYAPITLAQDFINLVRQRLPQDLDNWLEAAKGSSIKAFQNFAKGLQEDYNAVKAGLTLEVSNGPVEGLNNRLKMLKRQMFGRAGLDLLAKRFILTS